MSCKNTLFYSNNKEFIFDFTGSELSSDGGLFLLEKLEKHNGLIKSFASVLTEKRQQGKLRYSFYNLLKQRVFALVMGYEDCNDVARLDGDVAFEQTCGKLSSQPTLSRFENRIDIRDIFNLCSRFIDRYVKSLSFSRKRIIIDVDATNDPTHGKQQLSLYNGYYGHTSYTELLFHDGETGQLILPVLRPGNAHSNKWFVYCLDQIVKRIKNKYPHIEIILRGDTGYAGAKFFSYAKKHGIKFCTGLARNQRLARITETSEKFVENQYINNGEKHKLFLGPFEYKADSWEESLPCYAKIESTGRNLLVRCYVSNLEDFDAQELYQGFYCKRGDTSENRIKELKNMCFSDRLSCHRFIPNFFRLIMSGLCYEILRTIREMIKAGGFDKQAKWQAHNIRVLLLKIGVQVKKTKKRIYIHFAEHYLNQDIFRSLIAQC